MGGPDLSKFRAVSMPAHGNPVRKPVAGLSWHLGSKVLRIQIAKDTLRSHTDLTIGLVLSGAAEAHSGLSKDTQHI